VLLPELPPLQGLRVHLVKKETDSTPINMGFRYGMSRQHPDFFALLVANSAFGEHRQMGGRLFDRMREVRGLNYGDYSYLEHFVQESSDTLALLNIPRRQHAFTIWIRPVEPDDRIFAVKLGLFELQRLVEHGLTEEEFASRRGFLLGYTLLWEQGASRKLGYALDDVINGTPDFLASFRKALSTLTLDQVNSAVARHLQHRDMEITLLARDAEELRKTLLQGGPTPRSPEKTKGLDETYRHEDEVVAAFDLKLSDEAVDVLSVDELFER
jgi:zinc protease